MLGGQFTPASGRWNFKKQQRTSQHQSDVCLRKCAERTALGWCQESETPERVILPLTNMERFLRAITPSVPAQYISKTTVRDCKTCNVEYQPYFLLADLWESFKEWSAYGAGVPLLLNDLDFVVQYYVPYLSAIQIFVDPSKSHADLRRGGQENEGRRFVRDSIDTSLKMENFCLKDQQTRVKEGFSSDGGRSVNSQGYLVFQYLEHDTPFQREPLFSKISELASCSSELKNLRSCDMLSSSWFSVAWYPMYRIPTGPTMKDLEACFLTYHSLCTPLGLGGVMTKIPLPSFGLSSYKYRECMWASGSSDGQKLVNFLSEAACDWLKVLQVQPPDYNFFASRR